MPAIPRRCRRRLINFSISCSPSERDFPNSTLMNDGLCSGSDNLSSNHGCYMMKKGQGFLFTERMDSAEILLFVLLHEFPYPGCPFGGSMSICQPDFKREHMTMSDYPFHFQATGGKQGQEFAQWQSTSV